MVGQRKHRAAAACDFCRRRKLGCDNRKPKCTKCVNHNRECTFAERSSNERPSNTRIIRLQEENAALRTALESQTTTRTTDVLADCVVGQSAGSVEPVPAAQHRRTASSLGNTYTSHDIPAALQFYGPSSALHGCESPTSMHDAGPGSADHVSHKSELFAEASRQRQLEPINLKSKTLDFDGLDPEVGYGLLQAFWNRQHHSSSVVYRPAFMRDMACAGPWFNHLLFNAMMFTAFRHAPPTLGNDPASDSCVSGMTFRRKAEQILYGTDTQLLTRSSVTTIQALLVMADSLFAWCDERSLSWHYLGLAINMVVDLGMHTTGSTFYRDRSIEDQEIGRRVFWSAYVADKAQSIYQGRPPRLQDSNCLVPTLFLDVFDELDPFTSLTYTAALRQLDIPSRSVSNFEELCKLSIIADSIFTTFYAEKSSSADPLALLQASVRLQASLERWRARLPSHLDMRWQDMSRFDVLPHSLSLLCMYHSLVILLFRPFVTEGHLQGVESAHSASAFATCTTAATEIDSILRLYKTRFCLKACPYFISYATYASGTIHARIAAQKQKGSQAQRMLRNCLEVLFEQQEQCHAPRQSMKVLLMLAKRLGVDVGPGLTAARSRTDVGEEGHLITPVPVRVPQSSSGPLAADAQLSTNADVELDIDEILRSFVPDHQQHLPARDEASGPSYPGGYNSAQDASTCRVQDQSGIIDWQNVNLDDMFPDVTGEIGGSFDALFGPFTGGSWS